MSGGPPRLLVRDECPCSVRLDVSEDVHRNAGKKRIELEIVAPVKEARAQWLR
jgi:hypothetical protein